MMSPLKTQPAQRGLIAVFAILALQTGFATLSHAKSEFTKRPTGNYVYANLVTISGNFKAFAGTKRLDYRFRGALQNVSNTNYPDQLTRFDYVDNNDTKTDKLTFAKSLTVAEIQAGGSLLEIAGMDIIAMSGPKMSPKEGAMTLKVKQSFRNPFSSKKSSIQLYYTHGDSVSHSKVQYYNPRTQKWARVNHLHLNLSSPDSFVPAGVESVRLQLRDSKGNILESESFFASEL